MRTPPAGDRVDRLVLLAREQVVQLQVPGQQRAVRRRRLVGQLPRPGVDDRRGDAAVVEQRGVGREALLADEFLVVEAAVGTAVLGVPLRWDVAHLPVERHRVPPRFRRGRG
jgi:hypothetical protein